MKSKFMVLLVMNLLVGRLSGYAQLTDVKKTHAKPKLVVGVVVDQMRAEYLYRFQDNYSEDGFMRLIREGFEAKNTHYNYIPTATCLGHATIFTGTTPSNHGIVSNEWYSRELKRKKYCVEDSTVYLVDHSGINLEGSNLQFSRSPRSIKTSTITDELKLFSNHRSKVIGISLKDRSAISPAGHLADAAYWFNNKTGDFITSSFYRESLPNWLLEFNSSKKADSLLNLTWEPYLSMEYYVNSQDDNASFEKIFKGKETSTFPYNLKELRGDNGNYSLLTETPFGNSILTSLTQALLKGEQLGQGNETDFLTISYSSTDYVGHAFGIRSKELEDTYVRMDREIAILLNTLDSQLGKGNYLFFLTADHAASDHPNFLKSNHIPGQFFDIKKMQRLLEERLTVVFGPRRYIAFMDNTQLYFEDIPEVSKKEIIKEAAYFLKTVEGVKEVFAPAMKDWTLGNNSMGSFVLNSYDPNESGDIIYQMYSGWMANRKFGTSHSTSYTSDTHVPLLFFGWNVPNASSVRPYRITQIAPTISFLLNIPLANASDYEPLIELFEYEY